MRLAGQAVGCWDLTHTAAQSTLRMEKLFETQYAELVNRVLFGETLEAQDLLGHKGSETPA